MKIFGKHIFRSIKARPCQPIIITLTVAICAAVMIVSVLLPINIYKNERLRSGIDEWTSDVQITLKSTSDVRLIFEDDVEREVGTSAKILGEFSLTGFAKVGGGTKAQINIGAFDLEAADELFDIRYVELGKITNKNLDTFAIVSKSFADGKGIGMGDKLTVNILGYTFEYTVGAIAHDLGFFRSGDMMVDISSVRVALSERSSLVASLSKSINPYTKIHLWANDGVRAEQIKAELEKSSAFADKRIVIPDTTRSDYNSTVITITTVIPSLLLLIVAAMMITSSFELLGKKRSDDILLFKAVGADSGQMNLLLLAESGIYAIVGGIIGTVLSYPLISWLNRVYGFKYSEISFDLTCLIIGIVSSLIFAFVCTLIHLKKQHKKSISEENLAVNLDTDRHFSAKKLFYALPSAVLAAVTLLLPARHRYLSALPLLFAAVIAIYVLSVYVIGRLCALVSKLRSGCTRPGNLLLAARSCQSSYPLRHAGRIMTVLVTVFISMSFVLSVAESQMKMYVDFTTFDYLGISADGKTGEDVSKIDGVVGVAEAKLEKSVELDGGVIAMGCSLSGDYQSCFNENYLPKGMPVGDGAVISSGLAKMLEYKVGDRIKCVISDIPCELTVVEIAETHGDFVFYDAEYVGNGFDLICISSDGSEEARESITALLDERGIECLGGDEFFSGSYDRVNSQLKVFGLMFAIMTVMAIVGVVNVILDQSYARRHDFEMIMQNGMTKRGILTLKATEILLLVACAILMSSVLSYLITLIIDTIAISFGMTIYV